MQTILIEIGTIIVYLGMGGFALYQIGKFVISFFPSRKKKKQSEPLSE